MIINLEEVFLLGKPIKIDSYFIKINNNILPRTDIKDCKVNVSVTIKRIISEVCLEISANLKFTCLCDSCLEFVSKDFNYLFSHTITCSDVQSDELSCINISDYKLDLDSIVIEDVILEFPSKVVCCASCLGLCQKCGKNLNHGDCNCAKRDGDPRLEALRGLLD